MDFFNKILSIFRLKSENILRNLKLNSKFFLIKTFLRVKRTNFVDILMNIFSGKQRFTFKDFFKEPLNPNQGLFNIIVWRISRPIIVKLRNILRTYWLGIVDVWNI